MAKGLTFQFKADLNTRQTMRMFSQGQVQRRYAAMRRYLNMYAAERMLEEVKFRIPGGPSYTQYVQSLYVGESGTTDYPVFSVLADEPAAEAVQTDRDVIYLKPTNPNARLDPAIRVLIQNQPWTSDTLPFDPPSAKVRLVARKVTSAEVDRVRTAREKSRVEWTKELATYNVRVKPKGEIPKDTKAVQDLSFTALRLEYGLGNTKAVPHWRPALRETKQLVSDIFAKSDIFGRTLFDWKFKGWKSWRNLSAPVVPSKRVSALTSFQDKIR